MDLSKRRQNRMAKTKAKSGASKIKQHSLYEVDYKAGKVKRNLSFCPLD